MGADTESQTDEACEVLCALPNFPYEALASDIISDLGMLARYQAGLVSRYPRKPAVNLWPVP